MDYDDFWKNSQKPAYYYLSNYLVKVGHSDLFTAEYKLTFQRNLSTKYEQGLTIDLVEKDVKKCVKHQMKLGHSDLVYINESQIYYRLLM